MVIVYKCDKCGQAHRNKAAEDDDLDLLIKLTNPGNSANWLRKGIKMENEDEKIELKDIVPDMNKRILTGIRPTGHLHIGHYFGAARTWGRELQG